MRKLLARLFPEADPTTAQWRRLQKHVHAAVAASSLGDTWPYREAGTPKLPVAHPREGSIFLDIDPSSPAGGALRELLLRAEIQPPEGFDSFGVCFPGEEPPRFFNRRAVPVGIVATRFAGAPDTTMPEIVGEMTFNPQDFARFDDGHRQALATVAEFAAHSAYAFYRSRKTHAQGGPE